MSSIDPVGVAVDWFDAYRSRNLAAILDLYDAGAEIECSCQGSEMLLTGKLAIRDYWIDRFKARPFMDLQSIEPSQNTVGLSFATDIGVIRAFLQFNPDGKLDFTRCHLEGETKPSCCNA
jgi:hypothetical protein